MKLPRRSLLGLSLSGLLAVGGAAVWFSHQGYRTYVVRSASMTPALLPGDAVIVAPRRSLEVGDMITFRSTAGPDQVITHRLVAIDGKTLHTQGDGNSTPDPGTVAESDVVGKVVRHVPNGGFALVYLQQPAGVASILFILIGLMLAWSICFPTESDEDTDQERGCDEEPPDGRYMRRRVVTTIGARERI